jgi:hypothetical protein
MACPRCNIVPDAHSFNYFGAAQGTSYYYTSPSRARDYKETPDTFTYYKLHINNAKTGQWAWVIDCAGMQTKHYSSMEIIKNMIKILLEEHKGFLQKIYIIHPNTWIKTAMTLMKPFLKKETVEKINIIEGEKLELLIALEKIGLKGHPLNWLLTVFAMPFEPAVLPNVPQ